MEDNKIRILKNTLSLYIRMIVLTIISLFTVRVILHVLGDVDYGLYNVVGGFVSLFSFVSGTLAIASQRYFAISLAKDDWEKLNHYFSVNIKIYLIFICLIFLVAETVGIWFVLNKLTIPPERLSAVFIVYEFSVVSFVTTLISSPFQALMIADENLTIYSVISIVEGVAKVLVTYLLYISPWDKLIVYSFLVFLVSLAINLFYIVYSFRKYKKLKLIPIKNREDFKEILSYMNWNLIGAMGSVGKGQGINVVMNLFFSASINAARAIGMQINSVVSSFSQNFMKAVNPQITKKYASNNSAELNYLLYSSSKLSYFLLYIIVLPLIANIQYVLRLWLGDDMPVYTIEFSVLTLIDALILSFSDPLGTGVQATGRVKGYQLTIGILLFMNIPISYFLLRYISNPILPSICSIILSFFMTIGRIIVYKKLNTEFSIIEYIKRVVLPLIEVTIITTIFTYLIMKEYHSFFIFIIYVGTTVLFTAIVIYYVGLNTRERKVIRKFIARIIKRS